MGPIPCVDGIPIRRHNGVLEGALILRGTGTYKSKLALIGGVIAYGESVEAALRRHFRDDLEAEIHFPIRQSWSRPVRIVQYQPYDVSGSVPSDFRNDPTKHAVALTYLVTLENENVRPRSTAYGQEVEGMLWFSAATCPAPSDFGYLLRDVLLDCIGKAEQVI